MNSEELAGFIPDLIDGSLSEALRAEVEAALPNYPEYQRQIALAQQVRIILSALQAQAPQVIVPKGFEARLMARLQWQHQGIELLDLSSKAFLEWLIEWINLVGGLIGALGAQQPEYDSQ